MKIKNKILFLFVILAIVSLSESQVYSNGESPKKSETRILSIDLSRPEKTIHFYFEAFRVGDDSLLDKVLAPNASIPEFNPLQKILSPSPEIIGVEINKVSQINKRRKYSDPDDFTEPGDLEVYVTVKYDPKLESITEGHEVFLLRKIDAEWKVLANVPFWPEEIQELIKGDFPESESP